MKKNTLFLCAIVFAVFSIFSSCKKNTVELAISLTKQPASAKFYAGDSVTIAGTASTTGKFRMIQMVSVPLDGSPVVMLPQGSVTSCANTTGTVNFSQVITSITKSSVIKVNVIDQNGQTSSADFAVTILENNTTAAVTAISFYSATTGGNIADIGETVTARGVCYSTTPHPTFAVGPKTSDGAGVGSFVSSLTGLFFGQDYYVRAYSVTSKGILYGNEVTFTTLTPNTPTPLIPNSGFEVPVIAASPGFAMGVKTNDWVFTGGCGLSRNGGAYGAQAAPEGVQTTVIQGDGCEFSQTITFTDQHLALSFMASQRGGQKQTLDFLYDNIVILTLEPASAVWAKYSTRTFNATAGPHKITVRGTNAHGGDNSAFVDDMKTILRN